MSLHVEEAKKKQFLDNLRVNREDVLRIMNIPQRSPEWKLQRQGRMTASNYGSACGHNKYSKPRQLLKNMLWEDFKGNVATEYGSKNEQRAVDVYAEFMKLGLTTNQTLTLKDYGLIVCEKYPWLAVSPDGIPCINTNGTKMYYLLEIKCPFKKALYPHIPHYYYDQIQGIMALQQLPYCDFVVWTPTQTQLRRFRYDASYWHQVLFPRLQEFYMNEFMPRAIMKAEGILKQGELEPTLHIDGEDDTIVCDNDDNNEDQKLKLNIDWKPNTSPPDMDL
jgi:putative phage-type endonuclease